MSKVYNYMIVAVGLTLLLKFAGLPSGADALINYTDALGYESINLSTFFIAIGALFTIGVVGGIAIGFITKSPTESFIIAPIALGIFIVITSTFVSIITYVKDMGFIAYLITLIFVPYLIAFGIAIIEFWRGTG